MRSCPSYDDGKHGWVHKDTAKGENVLCQSCGKKGIVFSLIETAIIFFLVAVGLGSLLIAVLKEME